MNRQEELMKDWSLERRVEALHIVSNFCLLKKYSVEQLMTLQSNRDAFDLLAAMLIDMANEKVPIADIESLKNFLANKKRNKE